ncbi:MAG: glycosyltransferase [Granulosicoccus sp.]|nr:glycosyltransferase [Granulosicoccus sp.]
MKKPLNILVLATTLHVGGAETAMINLVRALSRLQMEDTEGNSVPALNVHFCAIGGKSVFGEDTQIEAVRRLENPVKLIETRRFYSPRGFNEVRRYAIDNNIDVIHTFLAAADILGNLLGKFLKLPVVTSLRNVPVEYKMLRTDQRWLMEKLVIPNAAKLVALSDEIRALSIDAWQLEPERIITIQNATDLTDYLAVSPGVPEAAGNQPIVISTVGRLMQQKAHKDLLIAAVRILERHPDVIFNIVGQGELESELKAQAKELNIEHAVNFMGMRRDIPKVLAQSDIFVLSSHWEGMSVAAIEAMAAARPQVLTLVGANAELIENEKHGLLVPAAEPAQLADALCRLIADKSLRLAMGALARERAREHFSTTSNSKRYSELYYAVAKS